MRISKLLMCAVALTMAVPSLSAKSQAPAQSVNPNYEGREYVTPYAETSEDETGTLYLSLTTGTFNPSDSDQQFTYNAETGYYELTVPNLAKKVDGKTQYFRFYEIDNDGNIIRWNTPSMTNVQFTMEKLVCEFELEKGTSSGFKIYSFANDLEEADVKFSVKLNTYENTNYGITYGSLIVEQLEETKIYPENIYLWGSNIGGRDTKVWGTLTSTAEEGVYELNNFLMPVAVFDPADGFGADQVFSFFLSTSNEGVNKGTRFLGHMEAVEGDASEVTIDLNNGQSFTTTLQTSTVDGSNLNNYTPGTVDIRFDLNTLQLSVKMLEAYNKSTLVITGSPNEAYEKYLSLEVSGEPYPLELTPQNIWYTGNLSWVLSPMEGWSIDVAYTTPDATVSIEEDNGKYTLTSTQNNLDFVVTISENNKVEFTFIIDDETADVTAINQSLWCIDFVGMASDEDGGVDSDGNIKDEFILNIESNPFIVNLNSDSSDLRGTMLMFVPNENYNLNITCTNWNGTDEAPFVIERPSEAADMGDLDGGSLSAGWSVILSPEAAGLQFEVQILTKDSNILNVDEDLAIDNLTVYNTHGVLILRNGRPEDLRLLPPGLYIANGKKIAIP